MRKLEPSAGDRRQNLKNATVIKRIACYVFAVFFVLAGWYITAIIIDKPALPTPAETVPVFLKYAYDLWPDFQISLWRLAFSLFIGTITALPIGLFLGRSKKAEALFTPVLNILYPLPKIVLLPILLAIFGLGGAPKVALISLTIFFQVVVVMRDAARALPQSMIDRMYTLGCSKLRALTKVIIPATTPELFTTLRVSSAVAIAVLFFAEAIAGSTGLGYFIMNSWSMVNYPRMFAGIIALAILGVIIYEIFDIAERLATRWKR